MLKKTITYPDLDGNPITEDFYFNLSKAELAEMELRHQGGFGEYLQRIIDSSDGDAIITTFKDIIKKAIGRRSEDGRRFIKNDEIAEDFLQTEAYSQLFMDLVTNAEAAAQFVRGIVPTDMQDLPFSDKPVENVEAKPLEPVKDLPAYQKENRDPTPKELQAMSQEEMAEAWLWKQKQIKNKNEE